jgi:uncharacterized protein (TIGR00295 family)
MDLQMNRELTPEKCIFLLKKSGCSDEVIKHSMCVKNIAVLIAKKAKADIRTVELGALLHDIGRSKTHGINHAIEGGKIAKKYGLSLKIIRIIERHIGAGLTAEVAKKLGLPSRDYIPITIEEKIVCHADNLIDNCKKQRIEYEIEKALKNNQKEYAERLANLHYELSEKCGIDLNNL